jgi:hypothetical protein
LVSKLRGKIVRAIWSNTRPVGGALGNKIELPPFVAISLTMSATIDLREMTTSDKLRLMEALWQNLATTASEVVSPEWHAEVLAERDRLIASGEETFIDWETAKKQLREELQ